MLFLFFFTIPKMLSYCNTLAILFLWNTDCQSNAKQNRVLIEINWLPTLAACPLTPSIPACSNLIYYQFFKIFIVKNWEYLRFVANSVPFIHFPFPALFPSSTSTLSHFPHLFPVLPLSCSSSYPYSLSLPKNTSLPLIDYLQALTNYSGSRRTRERKKKRQKNKRENNARNNK